MTRITKGLATASLLPLGVAVALVLAEALYRVTRLPALSPTTHPGYVRHDADLGWSHIPGSVSRHRTEEFDVRITINSDGFRGADWPRKNSEVSRVLLLGDSEAFGWGVDNERTFASLVSARRGDLEVLNAGISGYGTDQELLLPADSQSKCNTPACRLL